MKVKLGNNYSEAEYILQSSLQITTENFVVL